MKLPGTFSTTLPISETAMPAGNVGESLRIHLPFGLIGLPELTGFLLSPIDESWPFQAIRSLEAEPIEFVVIEPTGLIPDYSLEISDEDAEALRITSAEDALVLNIVTVHSMRPQLVTVNLAGPVLVNRRTLLGKQVILSNSELYSTRHALVDERATDFRSLFAACAA